MDDLANKISIPPAPAMAKAVEDGMYAKATMPAWKIFWLGLTGGAYIAFGFIMFVTTQQGAPGEWPLGITKMIGGAFFATGLIMVINSGSDLFTGTTLNIMPLLSKRITPGQLLRHWGLSYVANFIGSVTIAILVFLANTPATNKSAWGLIVLNVTKGKLSLDWGNAFVLGILCNFLVCMAVWLTFAGRSFLDKGLAIVVPLVIFVSTGFEHSVANMFMLPMGWLIKTFGADAFWAGEAITNAGVTAADFDMINWGKIIFGNLLPVTLGNIIGGALCVGCYFWVAYRTDAIKAERAAAVAAK